MGCQELAIKIGQWLNNNIIKHISLQMCFGGGNRAGQAALQTDARTVSPFKSFAYELARHCPYAESIGAVTNVHETNTRVSAGGSLVTSGAVVFTTVNGGYKQSGDKVIIYPNPNARPGSPLDPTKNVSLPASNKAKPW